MSVSTTREVLIRELARELCRRLELAPLEEKVPHLGVVNVQRFASVEQVREDPLDHTTMGEYSLGAVFTRVDDHVSFEAKYSFVVRRGPVAYGRCVVCGREVEALWMFEVSLAGTTTQGRGVEVEVRVIVTPLSWDPQSQEYILGSSTSFARTFSGEGDSISIQLPREFPELEEYLSFPYPVEEAIYQVAPLEATLSGTVELQTPTYFLAGRVDAQPVLSLELAVGRLGGMFTVLLRNYGVYFSGVVESRRGRGRRATSGSFRALNFTPLDDRSSTWAVGVLMEARGTVSVRGIVTRGEGSSRYWPKNEIVGVGGFYTVERVSSDTFVVDVTAGGVMREEHESEVEEVEEPLRESLEELARYFETFPGINRELYRAYAECVVEAVTNSLGRRVARLRRFQKEAATKYIRLLSRSGLRSRNGLPSAVVLRASTAAGKTLAFLLPTLFAVCARRASGMRGTVAMFVYPTRALALDQAKGVLDILWTLNDILRGRGLEEVRLGILAGESPSLGRLRSLEEEVGYRFRHPVDDRAVRVTVELISASEFIQRFSFDDDVGGELPIDDADRFERALSVVRDEVYANPPDILITTPDTLNLRLMDLPESHSIFGRPVKVCSHCRAVYVRLGKRKCDLCGSNLPSETERFAPPEVVVVDEAHQLRGSFGGQVSYVFSRFERVVREYLRRYWPEVDGAYAPLYVLSSATFVNSLNRVRDYLLRVGDVNWGSDDEFEEVTPRWTGDSRLTRVHLFVKPKTYSDTATLARILEKLGELWVSSGLSENGRPPRTIVFVNSIPENNLLTFTLNDRLGGSGWRIRGHSTDYSAARGRIEEEFSRGEVDLLVATSGLEVGVDFDEVDVVVIHGAPNYLADYRQRVGRAGRRDRKRPALVIHVFKDKPVDYLYRRYFEVVYDPRRVEEALRYEDAPLPVDNEVVRGRAVERSFFDYLATRPNCYEVYGDSLSSRRRGVRPKRVRVSSPRNVVGESLDEFVYDGSELADDLLSYIREAAGRYRVSSGGDLGFVQGVLESLLDSLSQLGDFAISELPSSDFVVFRSISSLRQSDEQVYIRSNTPIVQSGRTRDLGLFMTRYYEGSLYSLMGVNLVVDTVDVESARYAIPLVQDDGVVPPRARLDREIGDREFYERFRRRYGTFSAEDGEEVEEGE